MLFLERCDRYFPLSCSCLGGNSHVIGLNNNEEWPEKSRSSFQLPSLPSPLLHSPSSLAGLYGDSEPFFPTCPGLCHLVPSLSTLSHLGSLVIPTGLLPGHYHKIRGERQISVSWSCHLAELLLLHPCWSPKQATILFATYVNRVSHFTSVILRNLI